MSCRPATRELVLENYAVQHYTATIQPLYSQCTASAQPLYSHYTATIQPLYSQAAQPVHSHYTASAQPLPQPLVVTMGRRVQGTAASEGEEGAVGGTAGDKEDGERVGGAVGGTAGG